MASFNRVLLLGNLTRDPISKTLQGGTSLCEFGVAVNRKWKDASGNGKEEVTFVDCTAWGKTGEAIQQYLQKGNPIFIEGRLKLDQWDDKQTGSKRSKLSVVVEQLQFVGGREKKDEVGDGSYDNLPTAQPIASKAQATADAHKAMAAAQAKRTQQPAISEESHFTQEDIPF